MMIDCVLLAEQSSEVTAQSLLFLLLGSHPKSHPRVCTCVLLLFAVLKWLMVSAGRTFTTPVQQQLQLLPLLFKVTTHTNTHKGPSTALLPTQSYLPIKLNFSLHLLKMVRSSVTSCLSSPPSLLVPLSLQIAPVEIDENYDEMKQDARTCLSLMSQGLLYPEHIPLVLAALEEAICTHSHTHTFVQLYL